MISPLKILVFAILTTGFVAYFGEKVVQVADKVKEGRKQTVRQSANEPVYAETNRAYSSEEIRIPISRDGHYWATLDVNGTPVRFVVDTGASHIALSYKDAKSAGLGPAGLDYNRAYRTANGVAYKAIVNLDRLSLESIETSNILASVSKPGRLDVSLLGMNFLNTLSAFKVENRELILTP